MCITLGTSVAGDIDSGQGSPVAFRGDADPVASVRDFAGTLVVKATRCSMRWIIERLAAFLAILSRIFDVPPEKMDDGRSGNMPPPEGGISATGARG